MAQTVSDSIDSQRQLIADTSHQLRNPVGALRLRIDLLQLELQTAREHTAAAGVLAELERVEDILDGVLKLAAAEHRAFEDSAQGRLGHASGTSRNLIDPFPVLQEEVERAGPAAGRAGSLILLEGPPDPSVELACNSAELAQMVGELLNNAIKYASPARISVAARVHTGTAVIEISDDGPGLSAEERAAATSRFWRSPRHRDIRGNGLGVTIVDKLAEANGGRLLLAERSPHGLIARLEFPQALTPRGQEPPHD
jgi:signal transduction histidine kinase